MHGPLEDDFSRIFTRSSHGDMYKIMRGSPGCLQELLRGSVKDPDQDLHSRTPKKIQQGRHKRTWCWRGSLKDIDTSILREHHRRACIQAPLRHDICKIFMQGPLREDLARISTRSSDKDLYKIMQEPRRGPISTRSSFWGQVQDHARTSERTLAGSSQDLLRTRTCDRISSGSSEHLLTRTSTRPCARHETISRWSYRGAFQRIHKISLPEYQGISWNQHRATTRANQHAESAEMRAISKFAPRHNESDLTCRKWQQGCGFQPFFFGRSLQSVCEKKAPAKPRPILRASLLSWNAHGHLRRGRLREKFQGKCFRPKSRRSSCARLRNRNEHGQLTRI